MFGSEVRSKVRGKLFLRNSKASCMAFGTFYRAGMATNLVDSASRALALCRKIDVRYVKAELGNGGRIQWVSGRPGEGPAYAGTDFIIARDGRIATLYLFFDKLP